MGLLPSGYLASGTSYAPWFHMGIIHHLLKEKFPEIFEMAEPRLPEGRALPLSYGWPIETFCCIDVVDLVDETKAA